MESTKVDDNGTPSSQSIEPGSPHDGNFSQEDRLLIDDKNNTIKGSMTQTSFNYINSIIGSGVVGIPYALSRAGFGFGIFLLFVIAAVTDFSLCILVEAANAAGVNTYQALVRSQIGYCGYIFLTLIQFMYPFIAMVSYNIIIGDTITKVIRRSFELGAADFFGNRIVIGLFVTLFITYPLSLLKAIVKLSFVSFISLVFATAIMVFVFCRAIVTVGIPQSEDAYEFFNTGVTEAVGVIAFAYMCHHNSFLLYDSLENANQQRWNKVTHISMGISCVVIMVFGISGYSLFTGFSQGDLLENFCLDDDYANAARIIFAITIMLTFPIECFVTKEVCFNSILQNHTEDNTKSYILTTVIVGAAFIFSCITDCLNVVLELNGVLAAVPLAYILPAAAYIRAVDGSFLSPKKVVAAVLVVLGAIVALDGLVNIIFSVINGISCSHGADMPYCNVSAISHNSTLTIPNFTIPKTLSVKVY